MKYNQDFINIYGEMIIQNWLLMDRKKIKNAYMNIINEYRDTKEDLLKIIAFENYIIKYAQEAKTKLEQNSLDIFLEFLEDIYLDKPEDLSFSLLFKKGNYDKIFQGNMLDNVKKVKEYRERMAKVAMIKHAKKEKLYTDDKNVLMEFFIDNIDTDNEDLQGIMREYVKFILSSNEEIIKEEFVFLGYFITRYMLKSLLKNDYEKISLPYFYLINHEAPEKSIYIKGNILINFNNYNNHYVPNFVEAAFHETYHHYQSYKALTGKNLDALETLQNDLFLVYVKMSEASFELNHSLLNIEKQTNEKSLDYTKLFYLDLFNNKRILEEIDNKKEKLKDKKDFPFDYRDDGNIVPKAFYNAKHMNEIIYKHPRLLRRYPIFNLIYENNGNVKSIDKLLINPSKKSEISRNRIYYDYYLDAIFESKLLSLNPNKYSEEELVNICSNIINTYKNEFQRLIDIIKYLEKPSYDFIKDHDMQIISNYHVMVILKILDFIKKNYTIMKSLEKKGVLSKNYYNTSDIDEINDEFEKLIADKKYQTILDDSIDIIKKELFIFKNKIKSMY